MFITGNINDYMYTAELVLLRLQLQEISTRVHKLRRIMQHIKWSGIDLGHCGQPCNIRPALVSITQECSCGASFYNVEACFFRSLVILKVILHGINSATHE